VAINHGTSTAVITTAAGAQFEVNDDGIHPVLLSASGRRLLQVSPSS
jgi:hypothetical protein